MMVRTVERRNNPIAKKYGWILFAVLLMVGLIVISFPKNILMAGSATLTSTGQTSLGILVFCLILWITEPLPFHITGFIGLILLTVLKVDTFSDIVQQGFGSDTVIFFIGVLTISSCITQSGLGNRILKFILSLTGNNTQTVLLGFLVAGALISMWVTAMAVAAMLTPLAKAMLESEHLEPQKSNFGKGLMIACAWGPLIGGIGTPAGAGPNPLAIGFIYDMTGIEISFLDWMTYGIPCALLLILPAWGLLLIFFRPEFRQLSKSPEELRAEFKAMPPMSRTERASMAIFLLTAVLWISSSWLGSLLGIKIPTSLPAILSACLFFLPGVTDLQWKEIQPKISWDSIILIAAGISIGLSVYHSGAAEWLSMKLLGGLADFSPLMQIFLIVLIISMLKVGLSSNTVTATVIIPIMIAMTQNFSIPVLPIVLPASLTLSLAFILVTSTPTSVIPYSAGYFKISDMAKAGAAMTLIASGIMAVALWGIGHLTGIY